MPSNPQVTEIADGASATRLILRITSLDANGEQPTGPTTEQVVVEGIDGSPEGRALGSPGDLRIRRDVPQIWQKASGVRTTTGWQLVTGGGGGGLCDSVPQAIVAGAAGSPGIDGDGARCDHQHPVPTAAPITVSGTSNADGAAATLARSDHQHRLEVQIQDNAVLAGSRPAINFSGTGVTVSDDPGNDRVNVAIVGGGGGPSPGGVPNALTVGQAGAAGASLNYAREDHDHGVATAAPVSIDTNANAAGAATTFSRSDHQHQLTLGVAAGGDVPLFDGVNWIPISGGLLGPSPGGVPNALLAGQAGAAGGSALYAREDHDHAVAVAVPVTAAGATSAEGAAATFSRSDHLHRVEVAAQDDAAAIGSRPTINFTGAGVTVTDDGGNDRINIAIPGAGAAASWAATLGVGQDSGGTDPVLTDGDTFRSDDLAVIGTGGTLAMRGGNNSVAVGLGPGGPVTITGGSAASVTNASNGGAVNITGGAQTQTASGVVEGGAVNISGGTVITNNATSSGGDVNITGGVALDPGPVSNAVGGDVNIRGGTPTTSNGTGGSVLIESGGGGTGGGNAPAGDVSIIGGDGQVASAQGGTITITAGLSVVGTGLGANVDITAGEMEGNGSGGIVNITGGAADAGDGGDIVIAGGDMTGTTTAGDIGGSITLRAGTGTTPPFDTGTITIECQGAVAPADNVEGGGITITAGNTGQRNATGGDVAITAGDSAGFNAPARGGDITLTAGNSVNAGSSGDGGDVVFQAGSADNAGANFLDGNVQALTFDDGSFGVRTQSVGFEETLAEHKTFSGLLNVPTSSNTDVVVLGNLQTDGNNLKIRCEVTYRETADFADVSSTVLWQTFYRDSIGTVLALPPHLGTPDVQRIGAITAQLNFTLVISGGQIILRATNSSSDDPVAGPVTVRWTRQEGGVSA